MRSNKISPHGAQCQPASQVPCTGREQRGARSHQHTYSRRTLVASKHSAMPDSTAPRGIALSPSSNRTEHRFARTAHPCTSIAPLLLLSPLPSPPPALTCFFAAWHQSQLIRLLQLQLQRGLQRLCPPHTLSRLPITLASFPSSLPPCIGSTPCFPLQHVRHLHRHISTCVLLCLAGWLPR